MVEDGSHLWRCLTYIDLNMVRAGAVQHPREWKWTGFHELMGERLRYRLIDLDEVQRAVGARNLQDFRSHYDAAIEERLAKHPLEREPQWTESIAVGSRSFVDRISETLLHRRRFDVEAVGTANGAWILRDGDVPYV